jgi:23S rRNA pseudouridine955/2504/2580 synthase
MKQIKPSPDDIGQRLDRYLRKIFPSAKLWEIYEALRTKKITVGGKKLPESTRLREWDILGIEMEEDIIKKWQESLPDKGGGGGFE